MKSRDIDQTLIPANLEITDIGLSDPTNPTKITVKEPGWASTLLSDLLPTLLGTLLFVGLIFFMMNRMG